MTRTAGARSQRATSLENPWWSLALFALASLVLTYPLAFHLSSHIPLYDGDLWSNLWNFWWWKKALLELHTSPYRTDYLFFPGGVSLAFHTHSPLNMLAMLPVSASLGVEAAYNTAILLGFWLGAFGCYLLVRDLTGEARAAFAAGLIFAFTPFHLERSMTQLNLCSVQFLPLSFFFLRRLLLSGGAVNVVGAGLAFAANALVSWIYALIAVPAAVAMAVREGLATPRSRTSIARDLALASVLAGVLVLPFAWPMLREILAGEPLGSKQLMNRGADLAFWLIPSFHNPLLGGLVERVHEIPVLGNRSYLGWVPLGLAVAAVASRRLGGERRGFWGAWVAVSLILSLGIHPIVLGHSFDGIPLPHRLFEGVPLLQMVRSGDRFLAFATLGIAVLAGSSLAALFREGRAALAWTLSSLAMLEFLWLPYPLVRADPHPYLEQLAHDPEAGAVLPIPLPVRSRYARALYDQTRHEHPMVGGYVSYRGDQATATIRAHPFLKRSADGRRRPAALRPGELAELGIGTVLVHLDRTRRARRLHQSVANEPHARRRYDLERGFPDRALALLLRELRRSFGAPIFEDDRLVVFRVPGGVQG